MRGGFRYEIDKCVSCLACVAACKLINGGSVPWRQILSDNPKGYPGLPVHNLSIACNHCEDPLCLDACPTKAYYIDKITGAVLLSEKRCIGCNYCYWSCPFDAPQLNRKSGIMEKCHFCSERQANNIEPACTSACPTGALSYDHFEPSGKLVNYLPSTEIGPRIVFSGSDRWPARIRDAKTQINTNIKKVSPLREWSLILFTYLSSGLFGLFFAIMNYPSNSEIRVYALITLATLIIPVIHLRKPLKSWRAVTNILKSALSKEIVALLFFAIISNISLIAGGALLTTIAFAAGVVFLVLVDNVYTAVDSANDLKYHPGTVFLTGLIMASLFSGEYMPLLIIAILQILLSLRLALKNRSRTRYIIVSLFSLMMVSGIIILKSAGISTGLPQGPASVIAFVLIMAAEALNRIVYYFDFKPMSVVTDYRERAKNS